MLSAIEVADGKDRYAGRTLAEWVSEIVETLWPVHKQYTAWRQFMIGNTVLA